ncbi:MAG: GAF domain-containing protein [Acidobacteria bacterium]|nr:GAF domain-containing protein [Acidobacteriota bacterium]
MSVELRQPQEDARLRQYRALLEVAESIAAHRDLASLLRDLAQSLQRVVQCDGVNIVFHDAEHNVMRMNILESAVLHDADIPKQLAIEDAPAGWVWQTQQPLLMEDLAAYSAKYPKVIPDIIQHNVKTVYILPLTSAGRRLGAIGFGSLQEHAWDDEAQDFLRQVAQLVAVAADNAINFEQAISAQQQYARERDRLQLLLDINNAVVSHLDLGELVKTVSASLRDRLPHDAAGIALYDPEANLLREYTNVAYKDVDAFREGETIPLEGTPAGQVFLTGQPLLIRHPDPDAYPGDRYSQHPVEGSPKSACLALLTAHGRKLGIAGVSSTQIENFTEEDLELFNQIAGQIAIALENALNFERARTAEAEVKRQLERLRLMLKITSAVAAKLDLQELLHVVSASICEVMGNDSVGVGLFDSESGQIRVFAADYPPGHPLREEGILIPLEGSPSGLAFTSGQPVFMDTPDFNKFHANIVRQIYETGYRSGGSIPLIAQGRKLGVLGVASKREHAFSDDDKELLVQVANQVAIAVDNALNFERARKAEQEVKRQFERLQLMLEVNNATVSHLDLRELIRITAACLREALQHEIVGISLYDEEANQLRAYAYDFPDKRFTIEEGMPVPMKGSLAGLAITSGQPVFFNRIDPTVALSEFTRRLAEAGALSGGCVPLIVHGRKLGVLGVASLREDAFPEEHQQLLAQIAGQIAIAVDNSLNFERAREAKQEATHQSDRLSTVLQINNAVVSQLDLHELLQVVSRTLRKTIYNDTTGVALYDPESNKLRVVMTDFPEQMNLVEESYLIALEGSAMGVAFTSGEPIFLDEFDLERFPSEFTRLSYEAGLRSACNIPLIAHGRKLGALGVASKRPFAFSAEDRELLCQSANQIAIAVENALNFERTRAAEEEAKRQSERLQLMLEINNAVVSQLDLHELVRVMAANLQQVLHHEIVGLSLYDPEINQLRAYSYSFSNQQFGMEQGTPVPLETSLSGLAFTTGQPIFHGQIDEERFQSVLSEKFRAAGLKSGGIVPLIAHGRKLGTLGIAGFNENGFSESEKELLCQVANQIAIAVENALNFERAHAAEGQAKRQSDRRQLLLEINNAVVSHLDLRSLMQIISTSLRQISRHDVVGLALYDPDTNQLRAYSYDSLDKQFTIEEGTLMPLDGSLSGAAFTRGEPIFHDRIDEQRFQSDFSKRFRAAGLQSGGVVPLIAHGRKLGTLAVASYREANLAEDEKELLCQVASQVAIAVENALAFREIEALKNKLTSEKLYLENEIRTEHNFEELIGESQMFKRILKQVETVAPTDSTVLICGETGTGKELIARAIHDLSNRRERTLVKINCAAIPTGLLESELFGHEKGAFTGAISQRAGRFELANRGSLFLDEVGDIPLDLQPKLLRVLQEQEFERLGSTRTQKVDVRLIAATNCDLEQMVADRKYRSDLYYRLNVFPIFIPPLRQRREDIPALTRFFTQKYARRLKKQITAIPAEVMTALVNYHWPGNVRELEHFIERAVILTRGDNLEVSMAELKSSEPAPITELATLQDAEREHILRALEETNWVVGGPQGAAARLGMKRTTLQSKMQKLGIGRQS